MWQDDDSNIKKINLVCLLREGLIYLYEHIIYLFHYLEQKKLIRDLSKRVPATLFDLKQKPVLYLRENMPSGLLAGGSVGHALGIINSLESVTGCTPTVMSFDCLPGINSNIPVYTLRDKLPYRNVKDYASIALNGLFYKKIREIMQYSDVYISAIFFKRVCGDQICA